MKKTIMWMKSSGERYDLLFKEIPQIFLGCNPLNWRHNRSLVLGWWKKTV